MVVWALAAGVSLALVTIVAELVVRQFPELMPVHKQIMENAVHSPFNRVVADPDVGFLEPPGLHRALQTSDYAVIHETDRNGFPNADPWPDPVSLVFLGDSFVVGYGVKLTASFPLLISERLHLSEVNLGVAASGPERQLAVYRKFGMNLHPRHVFTWLYLTSDFDNDRHFVSWMNAGRPGNYDDYRLALARATNSRPPSLVSYAEKSWVYGLCRNFVARLVPGPRGLPERYRFPDGSELLFGRSEIEFAMGKAEPNDAAIDQLMASLEKMRNVVVSSGSTLSVVLVPSKEELFAVPPAATVVNRVSRARERLEKAGFAVLDLYPAIRRAGQTHSPYFRIEGHFNEYGHRVVAENFVSWFRQMFAE